MERVKRAGVGFGEVVHSWRWVLVVISFVLIWLAVFSVDAAEATTLSALTFYVQ